MNTSHDTIKLKSHVCVGAIESVQVRSKSMDAATLVRSLQGWEWDRKEGESECMVEEEEDELGGGLFDHRFPPLPLLPTTPSITTHPNPKSNAWNGVYIEQSLNENERDMVCELLNSYQDVAAMNPSSPTTNTMVQYWYRETYQGACTSCE